jgi:hypothetical protein
MSSYIVYVWDRDLSVMVVSVEQEQIVDALKTWCETRGWRVTVREPRFGPEHK